MQRPILAAGLILAVLGAPAAGAEPRPADPQPGVDGRVPGLAVRYVFAYFRHIDEVVEFMAADKGKPGEPLANIDSKAGDGDVLTSGMDDGVAAAIVGLISLDAAGTYAFSAKSNEGFRLSVGGVQVIEDPGVHYDRFSEIGKITVTVPGWYRLKMLYFERKSTSTIQLYWRPPGSKKMVVVPAEVLARPK
jgi:hypothetical protein